MIQVSIGWLVWYHEMETLFLIGSRIRIGIATNSLNKSDTVIDRLLYQYPSLDIYQIFLFILFFDFFDSPAWCWSEPDIQLTDNGTLNRSSSHATLETRMTQQQHTWPSWILVQQQTIDKLLSLWPLIAFTFLFDVWIYRLRQHYWIRIAKRYIFHLDITNRPINASWFLISRDRRSRLVMACFDRPKCFVIVSIDPNNRISHCLIFFCLLLELFVIAVRSI